MYLFSAYCCPGTLRGAGHANMTEIHRFTVPQGMLNNLRESLYIFFSYVVDKENYGFFLPFSSKIYQIFVECIDWDLAVLLSSNCRFVFCLWCVISLDFKFDLGNHAIFRNLWSKLLDSITFFLMKMLHLNKILHHNLREGSFPSFLWVVTSHLPCSLCSRGGKEAWKRKLFCASLFDCMWNVEWKWACLFLIFFFSMGYDVLVKTLTGKKN